MSDENEEKSGEVKDAEEAVEEAKDDLEDAEEAAEEQKVEDEEDENEFYSDDDAEKGNEDE